MSDSFREQTEFLIINGKELEVKVIITVDEDIHTDPEGDFDFGSKSENETYINRFKSSELFIGSVLVEARALGEKGIDSLGGCHLHSNNMFDSNAYNKSVNEIVNQNDMVLNALEDLKKNIIEKSFIFKPFTDS